jgi:hypothetical protein
VLKPSGKLISISGAPDADIAKDLESSWTLRRFMRLLSYRIGKKQTSSRELPLSFHESQRRAVTRDRSPHRFRIIRPVVDRVFPFCGNRTGHLNNPITPDGVYKLVRQYALGLGLKIGAHTLRSIAPLEYALRSRRAATL